MPTLNELTVGQSARIRDVVGDDAIAVRLMEMGLTEGEPIELLGAAPLGDPLEFSLRGYRLSLRKSEAARVQIDLAPAT
jgi:ferrous iron transport protein A